METKKLIAAPRLCERHDIVPMTLWRRERDERLNFPKAIRINGRRFYQLDEIEAWERAQVQNSTARPVRAAA